MNLANRLTVSRILAAFAVVALMLTDFPWSKTAALVVFLVAAATDALDGALARRRSGQTEFGVLMDPLADKILVSGALISFVGLGVAPAWMVVVLVAREFAVTGLRLLAASNGAVLPAERGGKQKTVLQMAAIVAGLAGLALREYALSGSAPDNGGTAPAAAKAWLSAANRALSGWFVVLLGIAVVFTVASGVRYMAAQRELWMHHV